MTTIILIVVSSFPDLFTVRLIVFSYWLLGSILFFFVLRILRFELKSKEQISGELSQQKQYLEKLIGNAPEGIVWVDRKNNIKYVNQKFTDIFGFTNAEAVGKNIDSLINRPEDMAEAQAITAAVAQGITQEAEGIRYRKDDTPVHVSIVGAPMVSLKGHQEVFGIYRDITNEKEAERHLVESEKSLRTLSDQLIQANNFKELLLDIITHDLRNPSGVISGALEILADELPDHEIIDLLQKSSDNLNHVIEDAGTLSRLSMGETIEFSKIDIVPLIDQIAKTFTSQLQSAGMSISCDLPESIELQSNRIFGEVISNYISNAVKYASAGGNIHITSTSGEGFVQIEVQDAGKTIPAAERTRVFKRKVQLLDGPRKGSGLGLAIVSRIAAAHDAAVGVIPNEPQGNIFFFRFNLPSD